jgi:predicted dehydrogenase
MATLDWIIVGAYFCLLVGIVYWSSRRQATSSDYFLAGRNVVLEKPFVSSLAEADALAALERETGKRLSPVFQYRFADGIAQFLHLRAKGFVGKAYAATVETHWRRLPAYYANPWRGRWATELGGCLVTHAIHNHYMLTMILGPARSVYARTATRVNPIETEDCAAAMLDPHALTRTADGRDRRVQPHDGFDLRVNCSGDAIHAADRLEHRCLHVEDRLEDIGQADRSVRDQFLERQRLVRQAILAITAGFAGVA